MQKNTLISVITVN